jgi:2,4'-dihydroxyacetophenone dioxygenase
MPKPQPTFLARKRPIKNVFPGRAARSYIRTANSDERYYVPFYRDCVHCALDFASEQMVRHPVPKKAGLVNRHYHPHEAFAYTISGKWGYLDTTGPRRWRLRLNSW